MYFAHPIDFFCLTNFEKKKKKKKKNEFIRYGFSLVNPGVDSYSRHFGTINKPRTLNDGGQDSVQYRNRKKALLLSSSHFTFYNLVASLSHLKALCLNVTSDALNNCLF